MKRLLKSIVLTVSLLAWLGGYVYFTLITMHLQPEKRSEKTDAIVVLTGGNFRTSTGLSLFAQGMAPRMMITGVNKAVTEEKIRELWRKDSALPECCIVLGHQATTTTENAEEAKKWIELEKINSIRLVTSTYHLQRALMEFRAEMPTLQIIPHPVETEDYGVGELKFWVLTFSEYNKYIARGAYLSFKKGWRT